MKYPKISAQDMRGVASIVPTPVKEGCDNWRATDVVNLAEAERVIRAQVEAGIDIIWTNGTYGEGASLLWEEIKQFAEVVIGTVNKRIPVFIGATTLNTRETIQRGKVLRDMGADGLFLGRPMWCALDVTAMVQFYKDVAEALPEMAVVVYDNADAFKGKIPNKVYAELAKIPQIVASKYRSISAGLTPESYVNDLKAVNGKIKLWPVEADWFFANKWFPEEADGCWSPGACCGPAPILMLRDALFSGNIKEAEKIAKDIAWSYETMLPEGSFEIFNRYNIQIEKIHFNAAGYMKCGPSLPPYHLIPDKYRASAEEAGRRWKTIYEKYSQAGARAAAPHKR
jgi:4-(2-carboxyphenyl)-2-oxobut-3-enoate aldolase